jgi:hypothetical protein
VKQVKNIMSNSKMRYDEISRVDSRKLREALSRSLSRVYDRTKNRSIGIVSTYRSERKREQNEGLARELVNISRESEFGFIHVIGRYIENKATPRERPVYERSVMLIGSAKDDHGALLGFLRKVCKLFEQEAVLYKPLDSKHAFLLRKDNSMTDIGKWNPNKLGGIHDSPERRAVSGV